MDGTSNSKFQHPPSVGTQVQTGAHREAPKTNIWDSDGITGDLAGVEKWWMAADLRQSYRELIGR